MCTDLKHGVLGLTNCEALVIYRLPKMQKFKNHRYDAEILYDPRKTWFRGSSFAVDGAGNRCDPMDPDGVLIEDGLSLKLPIADAEKDHGKAI